MQNEYCSCYVAFPIESNAQFLFTANIIVYNECKRCSRPTTKCNEGTKVEMNR